MQYREREREVLQVGECGKKQYLSHKAQSVNLYTSTEIEFDEQSSDSFVHRRQVEIEISQDVLSQRSQLCRKVEEGSMPEYGVWM
jgi:hypothetical protein